MSEPAAFAAARSRFHAGWANRTPIAWPNVAFAPPSDGTAWVRFSMHPALGKQASLAPVGTRTFRSNGLIYVQVFIPAGKGTGEAETLAEAACAVFRGISAGGVVYSGPQGQAPYTQHIGADGAWYQVQAVIPYWHDALH